MFASDTRLLIIENLPVVRKMIVNLSRDLGFSDITEATDGITGWEAISNAKQPFHFIFSDWQMPNCSGIDLLRRVRADQRFKKTPFIFITTESNPEKIQEAVKAGVSAYVTKPFTLESLKEKLESIRS